MVLRDTEEVRFVTGRFPGTTDRQGQTKNTRHVHDLIRTKNQVGQHRRNQKLELMSETI